MSLLPAKRRILEVCRRVLRAVAGVAFALQMAIPQGFMPGPVARGLAVRPCISVFPPAVLSNPVEPGGPGPRTARLHRSGHGDPPASSHHAGYCPVGWFTGVAGATGPVTLFAGASELPPDLVPLRQRIIRLRLARFHARDPPPSPPAPPPLLEFVNPVSRLPSWLTD